MSRLEQTFIDLNASNRKALITYIVAGDPNRQASIDAMHALVAGGADVIELGVPFSDPSAEGLVIQQAHERALAHNTSLTDIFAMASEFRQTNSKTPIVLMGYANPIEWMGYEIFVQRAATAGVDAVLTIDLPVEESAEFNVLLNRYNLNNVFLLAPTSSEQRIASTCKIANGFIYYVSLKGVTGSGDLDSGEVIAKINHIRLHTSLPICVGFGIKDGQSAATLAKYADGIVVGSALVEYMASSTNNRALCEQLEQSVALFRKAIDR